MSLRFSTVCNLLSDLEVLYIRDPPLLPTTLRARSDQLIKDWFKAHRQIIDAHDADLTTLLSTLLPSKRSDRVYHLQPTRLCAILGRCFRLGRSRQADLERWKMPDCGTLAECVERVQRQTPNQLTSRNSVTVTEVDVTLAGIASRYALPSSQPKVTENESATTIGDSLGRIYNRLSPRDCKWLTRLILKDFAPVCLNEYLVISLSHPLLPHVLKVRATLDGAVSALIDLKLRNIQSVDDAESRTRCLASLRMLPPIPGTFAGRPNYYFGRSVKYLVNAAHGRQMCLERKYDGEYCQVHIDLHNKGHEIQIFSKSGKDSTKDRQGVHYAIHKSLRIGRPDCSFNDVAILEGELLVWSDEQRAILPFHKIRNHVRRAGRLVGTRKDDRPPPTEHLMIMFYDILRKDDIALIHEHYNIRRRTLIGVVDEYTGLAKVAPSQVIDFSAHGSTKQLLECLSHAFARKWEGYMMKPVNEPYISMGEHRSRPFYASFFKIKKDYIAGLGDTADMLMVGASYDAATAARLNAPKIPWTHLHLACRPSGHRPSDVRQTYQVLHVTNEGIDVDTLLKLCRDLKFRAVVAATPEGRQICEMSWPFDNLQRLPTGRVIFREPVVFEVKGYGFEIPSNEAHHTLRFPKIVKVKWDSDPSDAISFADLQELAYKAVSVPDRDCLLTEVALYRKRLEGSELNSGAEQPWWEDTDSRSRSPGRNRISVYEDEDDTLTYHPPHSPVNTSDLVLQPLENLKDSGGVSLPLVRKLANGVEDYATRIQRIAARKKRKRTETPSDCDTSSADIATPTTSQVSIPLPKRHRPMPLVSAFPAPQALQKDTACETEPAGLDSTSEPPQTSSYRETPLHPALDRSNLVNGPCISHPTYRKPTSTPMTSSSEKSKPSEKSEVNAAKLTESADPLSPLQLSDREKCTAIVGPGVPEKYAELLQHLFPHVRSELGHAGVGRINEPHLILFLEPKNPTSAPRLHEIMSMSLHQEGTCIQVWDWRLIRWLLAHEKITTPDTADNWARQERQNYIGRIDIRAGQPYVTWAGEGAIALPLPASSCVRDATKAVHQEKG